ncbi:HSP90 family protein [Actinoallomurus sp. NPDC050550]|uniref:HSP90 family protein n=1 Tax=Actinoallomurus sp. NPDC050550 TaxID=3154937 RepID=UPI0033C92EA3
MSLTSATDHTFQVDLRGLVEVLSQHLYASPDVYVRELLQNAVDAISARRLLEPAHAGTVELEVRESHREPPTLIVTDNGIGLTEAELHSLLATIGRSSKRVGPDGLEPPADFIGRFGIGLLACFLVADEITVITRSAATPDSPVLRWRGRADGTYDTSVLDADLTPGTRVHVRARPGCEHQVARDHVLGLARHYGELLPVPVRLHDGTGHVHEIAGEETPPWEPEGASLEQQRTIARGYARRVFELDPLEVIHLHADGVRGVAFVLPYTAIPAHRQTHRVYLRRMLLTESADRLLPDWAFFVRCVVDADDLQPTAARDGFRDDERLDAVREQLGRCVRDHLVELARIRPDRLEAILRTHHESIAALAVHDTECLRLFADWLPLETSLGQMTVGEHARRFGELRFLRRVDDFRQIAPIAAAQGRCVVNAGYVHLADLLERLASVRPELGIAELDPTDVADTFAGLTLEERAQVHDLVRTADLTLQPLGCAVEARAFAPDNLPAMYITTSDGRFHRELDLTREMFTPGESPWGGVLDAMSGGLPRVPATRLLLNLNNPVVRTLAAQAQTAAEPKVGAAGGARVRRAVQLLYLQALLLGHHTLRELELGLLNDVVIGLVEQPEEPRP